MRAVYITTHAAMRFAKRVRPDLTVSEAVAEIKRLLAEGAVEESSECPHWAAAGHEDHTAYWLVAAGCVAFPVTAQHRVTTCLVRFDARTCAQEVAA